MSGNNSNRTPKPAAEGAAKASAPDAQAEPMPTGRVQFDDRGNAVWEWSLATGAFGSDVSADRLQKLEHPALSIADEAAPRETLRANPLGAKKGYDPYDSGRLAKTPRPRKKDLRRLGEFLQLQKLAARNKDGEE